MRFINTLIRLWKPVRIFLFYVIAILLVFWMYPREGKFQYDYTKNTPWQHEDLIAPFDFPIYKDEARIAAETDSITKHNVPYFRVDSTVYSEVLDAFNAGFVEAVPAATDIRYRRFRDRVIDTLPGLLKWIYDRGIIEQHPVIQEAKWNQVIIVDQQIATPTALEDVYSEKQAYQFIMDRLEDATRRSTEQIMSNFSLAPYLRPNVLFDPTTTTNILNSKLEGISNTQGMVQSGQIIIARGELVSPAKFRLVESLRQEYESNSNVYRNYTLIYLAQFILIAVLFLSLLWYVMNFRPEMMEKGSQIIFLLSLIVIMVGLTRVSVNSDTISYYVIPFAIIPIFLKTFFNVRFALFVHFLILLLAGFYIPNTYQFLLMNFLAGVVAVFSMRSYYRRSILFYIAVFIGLTYTLIYILFSLMQEGNLDGIDWNQLLWFGGNGLLILTVYPLIYIFERLFGFLSDATLFELSDTNQPLLRELAEKAPGTFQHSLQVASLAEEAVRKVGGNPLLVRTGALYHDIGKMLNPEYFIENQRDGINPHDKLDYKESAQIIIDHVIKGVEMGKKHNLPQGIIDFIRTHHGTSTVQYFYRSFINNNPEEEVSMDDFQYPGPRPRLKEHAVLMIADSVEAASRSMKEITEESIEKLVDQIAHHQNAEDQYDEADITFSDINEIKKIFKVKLKNIYHNRIAYPE